MHSFDVYDLSLTSVISDKNNRIKKIRICIKLNTVDSEMFARTLFSLIFTNSSPRVFKVLANFVNTNLEIAF